MGGHAGAPFLSLWPVLRRCHSKPKSPSKKRKMVLRAEKKVRLVRDVLACTEYRHHLHTANVYCFPSTVFLKSSVANQDKEIEPAQARFPRLDLA